MIKHNFLLFFRNIKKHKSTFLINIVGLSTGLACVLLIALWVLDELNFDKFHENDNELYQVWNKFDTPNGIDLFYWTPDLLAETMAEKLPEVKYATAYISEGFGNTQITVDDKVVNAPGAFADKDFFKMFSYNLLLGDKSQVLAGINSIVISETLARTLFGSTQNAIGKSIEVDALDAKKSYQVSGVFENMPIASSHQLDFALPFKMFKKISSDNGSESSWTFNNPITYIVLNEGVNITQFKSKIEGFSKLQDDNVEADLMLTKYSSNYLYGNFENGNQVGGRIKYIYLFSVIAFFILLIACINFMNLSTANASRRLKEIGIKKALGSKRGMLMRQYFGESILTAFIALAFALIFVTISIPKFNVIMGKTLSLDFGLQVSSLILVIVLLTGLLSGSYPAMHLSSFNPVSILKGKLKSSFGEVWVRKGLVVFQFSMSIILIVAVAVVYMQIEFVQTKNLGLNKDNVILFSKEGRLVQNTDAFFNEINAIPGIVKISSTGQNIIGGNLNTTTGMQWPGKEEGNDVDFYDIGTNYGFIETLNIQVDKGRTFSKEFSADSTAIILNETAIKAMGLKDPIGKTVNLWGTDRQIIGVLKDFHFQSFHEAIRPTFLRLIPEERAHLYLVKLEQGMEREVLKRIEEVYTKFNPDYAFEYSFLDENYEALYESEQKVSSLSKYFAGLAILISCLGLFGLATFTAERRKKEISIRKVLGQTVSQVILMLSGEFTKLVFIAILIALPVAYLLANDWLLGFAYRIPLAVWYFIGAGFLALLVALITVGMQAIRAATKSPIDNLRTE
ncbi:ABC-type antimicrobial peptide transport system permease subunit [Saonia flava]|uniref:ABC-type antimicrobial peptide transport system permease subunit n=1 Tax=Saonia flava TaxID=523696 RepID=A0A846QMK1_9FLAO|nr:ABC transporter permease [Saonia flava]NJB70226.1 ABC-type antimicrobial peptide transport system permease subunit [Saonia flava]